MTLNVPKFESIDYFVLLWTIHGLHGILYPSGIFNQILTLILLLWLIYRALNCLCYKNNYFIFSIYLLIAIVVIYGIGYWVLDDKIFVNKGYLHWYKYIQPNLTSLLPIIFFYDYFIKSEKKIDKRINCYLLLFFLVAISNYFKFKYQIQLNYRTDDIVNNIGYSFISIIPCVLLYRSLNKEAFLIVLISIFVFSSFKRGAIILFLICLLVFAYYRINLKKNKTLFVFVLCIVYCFLNWFFQSEYYNSDFFLARLNQMFEFNSSGRDIIWTSLLDSIFNNFSILGFFFGHGAFSTILISGRVAHQDWLEFFYCNGFFGLLALIFFFVTLIVYLNKSKQCLDLTEHISFIIVFLILFFKSLYSMSISDIDLPCSLLLGYYLAKIDIIIFNDTN